MAEGEPGDAGFQRTVKDLAGGAAGGIAQVLLGRFLFIGYTTFFSKNIAQCFVQVSEWRTSFLAKDTFKSRPICSPLTQCRSALR